MSEKSEIPKQPAPSNHLALLGTLSVIAGLVDVTGFFCFGHVFTAHITGNLVTMAVQVVDRGPPHVAQVMSIPVFALTIALAYFLVRRARTTEGRVALLVAQSLMLFLVLGLVVLTRHQAVLGLRDSLVGAMLAVAAMGFQNTFVRLSLHQGATTSTMTGNVATLVIALLSMVWPGPWSRDEAANKLRSTWPPVLGFFVGCAVAAASMARLGLWAWSLPALLSLVAIPVGARFPATVAAPQLKELR